MILTEEFCQIFYRQLAGVNLVKLVPPFDGKTSVLTESFCQINPGLSSSSVQQEGLYNCLPAVSGLVARGDAEVLSVSTSGGDEIFVSGLRYCDAYDCGGPVATRNGYNGSRIATEFFVDINGDQLAAVTDRGLAAVTTCDLDIQTDVLHCRIPPGTGAANSLALRRRRGVSADTFVTDELVRKNSVTDTGLLGGCKFDYAPPRVTGVTGCPAAGQCGSSSDLAGEGKGLWDTG